MHEVAFVELQVRVEDLPLTTDVGEALSVAVGAGVVTVETATLADALVLPPAPVQLIE